MFEDEAKINIGSMPRYHIRKRCALPAAIPVPCQNIHLKLNIACAISSLGATDFAVNYIIFFK